MKITVQRYSTNEESTLGLIYINKDFVCYAIEDIYQKEKIAGKTRIPPGLYKTELRTDGGFHAKYLKRFPEMHKGMIWIKNIPNFTWVYFHIGNTAKHSKGCILTGDIANNNAYDAGFVSKSERAYKRFYEKTLPYFGKEEVLTEVIDTIFKGG